MTASRFHPVLTHVACSWSVPHDGLHRPRYKHDWPPEDWMVVNTNGHTDGIGVDVDRGVGVTVAAAGHPASALPTARTISLMVTTPSWFTSPCGHADSEALPRATFTSSTNSGTVTSPEPSQSPAHGSGVGVGVDVGLAVTVTVPVGLLVGVDVNDGLGVGVLIAVDVGVGVAV